MMGYLVLVTPEGPVIKAGGDLTLAACWARAQLLAGWQEPSLRAA
jgi:hypothetical protein